jgi:superfamily I DNA and/or RNA helicase
MNVAITRARYSLIVLGRVDTLNIDRNWRALVCFSYFEEFCIHIGIFGG